MINMAWKFLRISSAPRMTRITVSIVCICTKKGFMHIAFFYYHYHENFFIVFHLSNREIACKSNATIMLNIYLIYFLVVLCVESVHQTRDTKFHACLNFFASFMHVEWRIILLTHKRWGFFAQWWHYCGLCWNVRTFLCVLYCCYCRHETKGK